MTGRAVEAIAWGIIIACGAALVAFALSPMVVMGIVIAGAR